MDTFSTPGDTRLVVYNPIGAIDVIAEDAGTTTVELIPRGTDGEAVAAETTVTCAEAGGVSIVTVTFPNPRSFSWRRSGARRPGPRARGRRRHGQHLGRGPHASCPSRGTPAARCGSAARWATSTSRCPSADVSAQVVDGSLSIKTASGDVDAGTVNGAVKVRTVSGDVEIQETNEDASLTLVSGDVSIATANHHVDITSVSGDVTVADAHDGASVKSTSGDVTVRRMWRGNLRAATVSGDVTVGIPPGRGISVDARSMSGELSSEIDLSSGGGDGDASGDLVRITAHSVSGDVEIQRASALQGRLPLGQPPAEALGDLLARGAQRVSLGVPARAPRSSRRAPRPGSR